MKNEESDKVINYIYLKNIEEWEEIYKSKKSIVMYFTASWCGPCKRISPLFKDLVSKFNSIYFVKIDVDEMDELAVSMGISCMPTFLFLKNKEVKYTLEGCKEDKLKELVGLFNNSIYMKKEEQIINSSEDLSNLKLNSSDDEI